MRRGIHVVTAALAAVTMLATIAPASSARTISEKRELASTNVDDDARGEVRITIRNRSHRLDGSLEVRVRDLERESTYDVSLDGVLIGSLETSGSGKGKARFRTSPRGHDQLLGVDPRGRAVVVSDARGVLLGVTAPSDSVDPAKIRCCLSDDSGPECEDRTPGECVARGGVDLGPGTCLPNPCEDVVPPPPGDDVRCCLADDSGPECEDRTPAGCAAEGGVSLGEGVCLPNPCEGTALPPELEDIRCCLPDDSGPACEDRTADECAAQGGVNLGAGSCEPNPCNGSPSPDDSPTPEVSPSPDDSPSPEVSPSPDDSPSPEVSPSPDDSPSPEVSPTPGPGGGNPIALVACERRADRSRVSVNGSGLAAGSYRAHVASGANQATSGLRAALGDEAQFDFDSDPGDIAAGATPIVSTFIAGVPAAVTGEILDAQGSVVATATVECAVR